MTKYAWFLITIGILCILAVVVGTCGCSPRFQGRGFVIEEIR